MCDCPQGAVLRSLLDVATGMSYLHGMGIVHGDLKAANVLLKSTATDSRGFLCKCDSPGRAFRLHNLSRGHAHVCMCACGSSKVGGGGKGGNSCSKSPIDGEWIVMDNDS